MEESGIIMFCSNNRLQIEMLDHCLLSIRHYNSAIPITLFHDGIDMERLQKFELEYGIFPQRMKARNPYVNKYISLTETPYPTTLYLDTDVLCTQSIVSLFDTNDLLAMRKNEVYDISVLCGLIEDELIGSTLNFAWYNTGVLVYDLSFVEVLLSYMRYVNSIPKILHFDQSFLSFIIDTESIKHSSSWQNKELQLVLCDTYIRPQYPDLLRLLEKWGIDADMNYTNHKEFFFSEDFKSFLNDAYYFVHYNLGNPTTPHLKANFFREVVQAGWFHKVIATR